MKKIEEKKLTQRGGNKVKNKPKISGITLIALVVTIVVLLILVAITITLLVGDNGIFKSAEEAAFKQKMATYKEKVDLYTFGQVIDNPDTTWINSGEMLIQAILDGFIEDITEDDVTIDIRDILSEITTEEEEYIVVYKGEMYYVSNPNIANNDEQVEWCTEIHIPILEYTPPSGIDIVNGDYELVDGIYVCTPDLTQGFNKAKTRYLEVGSNGSMVPGNWVTHRPTANWYSYRVSKWANIYVENGGQELYYVWIPRYCFKLDQDGERSEVQFIDVDNSYKDPDGNVTTWEQRIAEDPSWQIPEAFTFDGKQLPGYWVSKYTVGDATSPTTINFEFTVVSGTVTIRNITLNTDITSSNPIVKYTIALNGKIIQTISDSSTVNNIGSQVIEISGIRKGDNTINVTGLNSKGEVVGSMTKEYNSPIVNEPDLSGFNEYTTFYVTYDENGNEHSTIPITQPAPENWYEYGSSEWANIVTRNNNGEVYYVWIPRYEFKLDQANERSTVRFIQGTGTTTTDGYQIPEAFTFNGQQLTGYWIAKYTVGDVTEAAFNTEMTATGNSIRTSGITGTGVTTGLTYNYYLDGEKKGSSTNATESFEYTGLQQNKTYTVLVEVRNGSDEYVGSITRQITTQAPNAPDLSGFNPDVTYYVLYDNEGNETIGSKITTNGSNAPGNWYDYSQRKWANIVVDTGSTKTYYTWIPRYQFKLDQENERSIVEFLPGTSTQTKAGYQIPEAFTFNGQQLTGYWVSKYTVGE